MSRESMCPNCGRALPAGAPQGLCPECLVRAALGTGVEVNPEETAAARSAASFNPPTIDELAPHFPQLEMLAFVGRGGMGAVYKARQKELDRLVALKILPPGFGEDPAFADRFVQEAKAMARLNHPGIVTIHEFGRTDGLYYFVMEFVDGTTLRQLLNYERLAPREALAIVPQICDALQYAHDQGIVHCDIKPENILIDRLGRVKVADFGVARLVALEGTPRPASKAGSAEAGRVMGTPQYMAPEQRERPQEVDHRADIYALGVVFYQMLTGELPSGRLEPPSRKVHVDVRLDEVVLRALEREPARRYQAASQIKTDVETISETLGPGQPQAVGAMESPPLGQAKDRSGATASGWREAWLTVHPAARRVICFAMGFAAVVLFACFAWPGRVVMTGEGQTTEIWSFGVGQPWLMEVRRMALGGNQNWPDHNFITPAFAAGVVGIFIWIALGALYNAHALAERPAPANGGNGTNRVRLRHRAGVILSGLLMGIAAAHGALLACALLPAPAIPTMILAASISASTIIAAAWRQPRDEPRSRQPSGSAAVIGFVAIPAIFVWFLLAGHLTLGIDLDADVQFFAGMLGLPLSAATGAVLVWAIYAARDLTKQQSTQTLPADQRRWCRQAIASAVLLAFSMPLGGAAMVMAKLMGQERSWDFESVEVVITAAVFLVTALLAAVATLWGVLALRRIGLAGGELRGRRIALAVAWFWPCVAVTGAVTGISGVADHAHRITVQAELLREQDARTRARALYPTPLPQASDLTASPTEGLLAGTFKPVVELKLANAGMEEGDDKPLAWEQGLAVPGVEYVWDRENAHEGKASLCLKKTLDRYFPIAEWYQAVEREGQWPVLQVAARVKAEQMTKAIVDVAFLDDKGEWQSHEWACYIGAEDDGDPPADHDWKEYTGQVAIPPDARQIQIGLQVYGPGTVWFDEVKAFFAE